MYCNVAGWTQRRHQQQAKTARLQVTRTGLVKWATSDLWLIKDKPSWWFRGTSFADKSREVSRCNFLKNTHFKKPHLHTTELYLLYQPLSTSDWWKKKLSYCRTNASPPGAVHSQLPDIATGKNMAELEAPVLTFMRTDGPLLIAFVLFTGALNGCNMKRGSNTHCLLQLLPEHAADIMAID